MPHFQVLIVQTREQREGLGFQLDFGFFLQYPSFFLGSYQRYTVPVVCILVQQVCLLQLLLHHQVLLQFFHLDNVNKIAYWPLISWPLCTNFSKKSYRGPLYDFFENFVRGPTKKGLTNLGSTKKRANNLIMWPRHLSINLMY